MKSTLAKNLLGFAPVVRTTFCFPKANNHCVLRHSSSLRLHLTSLYYGTACWETEYLRRNCRSSRHRAVELHIGLELRTSFYHPLLYGEAALYSLFPFDFTIADVLQNAFSSLLHLIVKLLLLLAEQRWTRSSACFGPIGNWGIPMGYVLWIFQVLGTSSILTRACVSACT